MTTAYAGLDDSLANPLDLMEQIASAHDWLFDRTSDQELALEVTGSWCDYRMFLVPDLGFELLLHRGNPTRPSIGLRRQSRPKSLLHGLK